MWKVVTLSPASGEDSGRVPAGTVIIPGGAGGGGVALAERSREVWPVPEVSSMVSGPVCFLADEGWKTRRVLRSAPGSIEPLKVPRKPSGSVIPATWSGALPVFLRTSVAAEVSPMETSSNVKSPDNSRTPFFSLALPVAGISSVVSPAETVMFPAKAPGRSGEKTTSSERLAPGSTENGSSSPVKPSG